MLFADERHHSLTMPSTDKDGSPSTIAHLIDYLCQHVMKDTRKELFVLDGHLYVPCRCLFSPYVLSSCPLVCGWPVSTAFWWEVPPTMHINIPVAAANPTSVSRRPGILVLINDADWELEGEEAYEIQPRDNILFVSTLHGG